MKRFGNCAVKIDGSVHKGRGAIVKEFQTNPKIKLFVGNIKAAGVGLTLTAASNVVFLELPWNHSLLDQASDRCHRIGQLFPVTIYFLLAKDSIMARIGGIIDRKRTISDSVLDGIKTPAKLLIRNIMSSYEKEFLKLQ